MSTRKPLAFGAVEEFLEAVGCGTTRDPPRGGATGGPGTQKEGNAYE
jgi:hypothetical protein